MSVSPLETFAKLTKIMKNDKDNPPLPRLCGVDEYTDFDIGPIAVDDEKMCNRKFEFSEKRSRRITKLFWHVAIPDGKSICKMPCTSSKYCRVIICDIKECVGSTLQRKVVRKLPQTLVRNRIQPP